MKLLNELFYLWGERDMKNTTTYTIDELTALLDKHGIKYCEVNGSDSNYIRVDFDRQKEVTIELTLSESDLFYLNNICKERGGRTDSSENQSFYNRIRYLTRDVYDHKNNKWRKNPLSKSLGSYKCRQSEREFNEEMSDEMNKEMARTVIFDKDDLIAIDQAEKLLNGDGRFGILNHIVCLTNDEFDHEKQEWRKEVNDD